MAKHAKQGGPVGGETRPHHDTREPAPRPRDHVDGLDCALLSEDALSDWSSDEEDAAWAHLQREP